MDTSFIHHPQRHTKPRVRKYLLDDEPRPKGLGPWVEVDWETAIDLAARGLNKTRDQYGANQCGCPGFWQVSERRELFVREARSPGLRN